MEAEARRIDLKKTPSKARYKEQAVSTFGSVVVAAGRKGEVWRGERQRDSRIH